jgi:hypothetical protein
MIFQSNLQNVEFDLGRSGRVFPDVCVSPDEVDVILVCQANI